MPFQMPQTSVDLFCDAAAAGMVADMTNTEIESFSAQVGIDFGFAVVKGTNKDQVKLPTSGADVSGAFRGWAKRDVMREPGATDYRATDTVPVLRKGKIWVPYEGTPAADGAVYVVNGSGAGTAGKIRHDANGGAATLVSGAIVRDVDTTLGLALIQVNMP